MRRKIYSINITSPVTSSLILIVAVSFIQEKLFVSHGSVRAEEHAKEGNEQLHQTLMVDTKYWLGNTELGERDNWLNGMKPCTLLERIRLDEKSAISISDYMDSWTGGTILADIKDLALAQDGMLLLEEDTLFDPEDPMFIQYLNESGECFDSSNDMRPNEHRLFNFRPTRDQMSWFNPDNWVSVLYESEISDWIPESHRIPCSEDVVVFGSREAALGPTIDSIERSNLLSFKVNFEPSEGWPPANDGSFGDLSVNQLRVSKLKIGNLSYNQHEFEQLINSEPYENILFEFNCTRSLLKSEDGFAYPSHSLLTIDESSIQPGSSYEHCLDEAGCLCGNDNTNILKIICSFNHPIEEAEQPCHDPIPSTGYCNKICATVITINMDPSKFSEKFLSNTLYRMLSDGEMPNRFAGSVFTGGRRTQDNQYEITFRNVPATTNSYDDGSSSSSLIHETNLGKEREFAQLVYEKLNNGAIKTFYGIKSITIRSSVDWRQNNSWLLFWISYAVLSFVAVTIFVIQDDEFDERVCHPGYGSANRASNPVKASDPWRFIRALRRLSEFAAGKFRSRREGGEFTESFERCSEPIIMSDSVCEETTNRTTPEIPLVDLDSICTTESTLQKP